MFWGLTPALDLQKYKQNNIEKLNILLIGGSDGRHILKTIANRYRHEKIELNFYVIEACMETVARQMLLLLLAFMPTKELGEIQKTRIFMELYGNTIIRPYVSKFLNATSKELLNMVTDYDYLTEILPFLSIDIKYKERDYLENLVKFWCGSDDFNIYDSWDRRVRKMLGVRYDSKYGAFDWDLHMRFHAIGGAQVCPQEYKSFRNNGVSFTWLESEVSKPNRSLVCATIPNGEKYIHYGYLGDIQTGPFVTYGLECDDPEFLKTTNGHNKYRATDVTERNLRQIFHEIEHENEYEHKTPNDYFMGAVRMLEDTRIVDISSEGRITRVKNYKSINLNCVNIKFLSMLHLKQMAYKGDYKEFFNIIYFCSTYLEHIKKETLENIAVKNAVLLIENQRFVLNHRDKELREYADSIRKKMENIDAKSIDFDPFKDNYAQYILKSCV